MLYHDSCIIWRFAIVSTYQWFKHLRCIRSHSLFELNQFSQFSLYCIGSHENFKWTPLIEKINFVFFSVSVRRQRGTLKNVKQNDSFQTKSKYSLLCGYRKFVPIELTHVKRIIFKLTHSIWCDYSVITCYCFVLFQCSIHRDFSRKQQRNKKKRSFKHKNRYALSSSAPMGFNSEKFLFHFTSHARWSRRTLPMSGMCTE